MHNTNTGSPGDWVIFTTKDGRVVYYNKRSESSTNTKPKDMVEHPENTYLEMRFDVASTEEHSNYVNDVFIKLDVVRGFCSSWELFVAVRMVFFSCCCFCFKRRGSVQF